MLDTGSTSSFCTRNLVNELSVRGTVSVFSLNTLSQVNEHKDTEIVSLSVRASDGGEVLKLVNVYVVDAIPVFNPLLNAGKYPHLKDLSVDDRQGEVDILVGQDHAEALIPLEI